MNRISCIFYENIVNTYFANLVGAVLIGFAQSERPTQEVSLKERKQAFRFLPVAQYLSVYKRLFLHPFPACHCATCYKQVSLYCGQPFRTTAEVRHPV